MYKIGLLGGTFDPVHWGHMGIAQEAQQKLDLHALCFIPCKQPVHKQEAQASVTHRLEMLRIAIQSYEKWYIDVRELNRTSPSYMAETIESISQEYQQELRLYLLLGADSLHSFQTWYRWEWILSKVQIVVADRDSNSLPLKELSFIHSCVYLNNIHYPISSTQIRREIKKGFSAASFLPLKVWHYIQKEKLYI